MKRFLTPEEVESYVAPLKAIEKAQTDAGFKSFGSGLKALAVFIQQANQAFIPEKIQAYVAPFGVFAKAVTNDGNTAFETLGCFSQLANRDLTAEEISGFAPSFGKVATAVANGDTGWESRCGQAFPMVSKFATIKGEIKVRC